MFSDIHDHRQSVHACWICGYDNIFGYWPFTQTRCERIPYANIVSIDMVETADLSERTWAKKIAAGHRSSCCKRREIGHYMLWVGTVRRILTRGRAGWYHWILHEISLSNFLNVVTCNRSFLILINNYYASARNEILVLGLVERIVNKLRSNWLCWTNE